MNFVGACVEFDKVLILTSYCSKGSLQVRTMYGKWYGSNCFVFLTCLVK